MSKIIESPSKRWPGKIYVPDSLTMPQYMAWIDAADKAKETSSTPKKIALYIPGVLACVEKWELGGTFPNPVTVDNFPATPSIAVSKVVFEIIKEIWRLIGEEDEVPND